MGFSDKLKKYEATYKEARTIEPGSYGVKLPLGKYSCRMNVELSVTDKDIGKSENKIPKGTDVVKFIFTVDAGEYEGTVETKEHFLSANDIQKRQEGLVRDLKKLFPQYAPDIAAMTFMGLGEWIDELSKSLFQVDLTVGEYTNKTTDKTVKVLNFNDPVSAEISEESEGEETEGDAEEAAIVVDSLVSYKPSGARRAKDYIVLKLDAKKGTATIRLEDDDDADPLTVDLDKVTLIPTEE